MNKDSRVNLIKTKGLPFKINTNKSYNLVLKQYTYTHVKAFIHMDYIYNINYP